MKRFFLNILLFSNIYAQVEYNHPELDWHSFETKHFQIHFHDETEMTAREAAVVAETVYYSITKFYDYEPQEKTHLILIDPDDYSNGAAYYYDNKIMIWATPLDFHLRGSHRWLQNVITHEFAHIVSLQKSMKAGTRIPGAYFQYMNYEDEKRPDVLYGYPNTLISYPIPGTNVPPWLAEGIAQFMYDDADWDNWDSHRDMILRDRVINDNMLSFTEMNTFGKKGIGNESTYNSGFALATYIANEYGSEKLSQIMDELSSPFQFSIDRAIENVIGKSGNEIYQDFKNVLEVKYNALAEQIYTMSNEGEIIQKSGTTNIHPKWRPKTNAFVYLSNKGNDFFGQTDLYYYDIDLDEEKKIKGGVSSAPTWHLNGKIIYYSKKSKFPNKNGSKFFDIYSYDFDEEEEKRLTYNLRAFNPVFIEEDSSIAFLATYDGGHDIYLFDLKNETSKKITDFHHRPMISHLSYDYTSHKLYFDITNNHFRDIYSYDLNNDSIEFIADNPSFDERNMTTSSTGLIIYSQDKSGIYNLYMKNLSNQTEGYLTNVTGGAFMPDISENGRVLYAKYDNGSYTIALLDKILYVDESFVGYSKDYHKHNNNLSPPITTFDDSKSNPYEDQFPNMFILPKLMLDYGTLKPGFYFSSSEIINRLALFGGVSINKLNDVDLFFIFDFKRFYPTIFFETYYLTRNTTDNSLYQGAYPIKDDIKFRLVQFRSGMKLPLYGTSLELAITRQWYRAFIEEEVLTNEYGRLEAGAAYDYFRGWALSGSWAMDMRKRTLDKTINPSTGFTLNAQVDIEKNNFIEGLNLSDSGTLLEDFQSNDLTRIQISGTYHYELPWTKRWTVSLKTQAGYITKNDVDSFFHFYLGGMPGLKGYPFYSIQGTKSGLLDVTFRIPLFSEQHYKFNWMILQNSTLGAVFQAGDAWTDKFSSKKSLGIQWRMNGFSFYNFPTAIELEYHHPINDFTRVINEETIYYGEKGRAYAKVLFDF
ncbi:MAG: hypothetical protein ACJZ12_05195 [Candidatus Neomarinimicrobiota bacterium]